MSTFADILDLLAGDPHRRSGLIDLVSSLSSGDSDYKGPPSYADAPREHMGAASWRRVAARLHLVVDPARGSAWSRTIDDVTLVLRVSPRGSSDVEVNAFVSCPEAPTLLVIGRRFAMSDGGLLLCDARFDEALFVEAADKTVLGAFDVKTRAALRAFGGAGGYIADGAIRLDHRSFESMEPQFAEAMLMTMMGVGARLQVTREERLAQLLTLIRSDPDPKVRQQLHVLFGADPEVRALAGRRHGTSSVEELKAQVADPFAERVERGAALEELLASPAAGPNAAFMAEIPADLVGLAAEIVAQNITSGVLPPPVGLALVAYLDHNPAIAPPLQTRMLDALGATRDGRLAAWLGQACDAPVDRVADAAMGAIMRLSLPPAEKLSALSPTARHRMLGVAARLVRLDKTLGADMLVALFPSLARDDHGLRCAYLEALREAGDERHAHIAVDALASEDADTRLAAITTLAAIGGAAHVAALTGNSLRSSAERERARVAVQAIHARIGTHLRGGVAVTDEGARGGVSIVDR